MYYQNTMGFSEWIVAELEKRGWSRSEAARRGKISPSMFDKVINGYSKPGMKFIDGIARAFKVSKSQVMMHVDSKPANDQWAEDMADKFNQIPPQLRGVAERFIDSMIQGEETDQAKHKARKNNHPAPAKK